MDDIEEITVEILIGSTDKATRMENVIMGLFGNRGNKESKPLGFGEVPPKPKLGFTPKRQDKALDKRDKETWRKTRRGI